ncbi:MAG: hypothetical protein V5A23_04790 [Halobacteriales archaeon]
MTKDREACGRCGMSSVVDAVDDGEDEGYDPFDGDRIEVQEAEIRTAVTFQVWAGRVKQRLDEFATRITYGR